MTDNVVVFPGSRPGEATPDAVLDDAAKAKLEAAIVIGYDENGYLYFTHSEISPEQIVWLLRCAERDTFAVLDL